jgi:hypothetical protein
VWTMNREGVYVETPAIAAFLWVLVIDTDIESRDEDGSGCVWISNGWITGGGDWLLVYGLNGSEAVDGALGGYCEPWLGNWLGNWYAEEYWDAAYVEGAYWDCP